MKFFALLWSILVNGFKVMLTEKNENPALAQTLQMARKLAIASLLGLATILLFSTGLVLMIVEASLIFDREGSFIPSTLFWSSLILSGASLVFLMVGLQPRLWPGGEQSARSGMKNLPANRRFLKNSGSPVENALALLISDIVEERRSTRAKLGEDAEKRNDTREDLAA